MERYAAVEAAERARVSVEELGRLVESGILTPDATGRFDAGDIRRAGLLSSVSGTHADHRPG